MLALLLAGALIGAVACDAPPTIDPERALRADAIACDVRLSLLVTWPGQGKAEWYEVKHGILGWGGGRDALAEHSSWHGAISAEACGHLKDAMAALCGALPAKEQCDSKQDQYDLVAWCEGKSSRVVAPWPDARLGELPSLLAELARARLTPALDKLPQAGGRLGN